MSTNTSKVKEKRVRGRQGKKKVMKSCPFCNFEIVRNDYILYQDDHFFIKVPYGLIAPGHIILVTFADVLSFVDLKRDLWTKFIQLKDRITDSITKCFAKPFLLEYVNDMQTVKHAHMHFIPLQSREFIMKSYMEEVIKPARIPFVQVQTEDEIKAVYQADGEFLRLEEDGQTYIFRTKFIADQNYLDYRIYFAQAKGLKGVSDWQGIKDEEKKIDELKREETAKLFFLQ